MANAVSRLPRNGFTPVDPDLDVPGLIVEAKVPLSIIAAVYTASWTELDTDRDDGGVSVLSAASVEVTPISAEEIRSAQEVDAFCKQTRQEIESGKPSLFGVDERGVLVRIAPLDGVRRVVVPENLRTKVVILAHHTRLGGHPGITRMYYTLRRIFYWPMLMADVKHCCQSCYACAKERTNLRRHTSPLKLFPAKRPLESVAIEILGPLTQTVRKHRFVLVMTCRYSKLTRVVPLVSITALSVARPSAMIGYFHMDAGGADIRQRKSIRRKVL